MSGAPKRLPEEGGHSTTTTTTLKRAHEDTSTFSGLSGKVIPPVGNDFRRPFESGQEGRLSKVQRTEPREVRDVDKRPPPLHRIFSSPNDVADHPVTSDSRLEFRNSKDVRDVKAENKEARTEFREFNSDKSVDTLSKADNDVRSDARGEEKEFKSDRVPHIDYKVDAKFDRDSYAAPASQLTWSKEQHRGKRYESTSDGMDSWRVARHGLHNTVEVVKDSSRAEEWDSLEAHEAVGENKIDLKREEKFREKEKKRKEEKQRDFGEREKNRNEHRNNLHPGEASNERRELREDKEQEKWEREKKETKKDKEHSDKEKDASKRESPIANERENWHREKDMREGSTRVPEQENTAVEAKRPKDDNWKTSDIDFKDKKREKDRDVGDRHEQRGKSSDNELDDGFAEGDDVTERDRESSYGNSIPHRRMSRMRGTPQAAQREPRFRSKARDNEGSQGKLEVSTVVYKAGECVQELLKSWNEFEGSQENKKDENSQNYPTLEIRIPAEHVTSSNRQVRGAQLWGTDIYTNDSDLFAVLMHTGYCRPTSSPPSPIQELRTTVIVLPPQEYYTSTLRNNVRSRAWGAGIGCSFRVERCCIVKKGGGTIDLEPRLTHISALEPTLAPVSVERTMTTRSAASNALRQQRFVREVSIQYNLCNEPWLKYSISMVADKGLKKPLYTSARLKKGEVLYLETHSSRYELCYTGEKAMCNGTASTSALAPELDQEKRQHHSSHTQNGDRNLTDRENIVDVFRWSRCKKILPGEIMLASGIPVLVEDLEVIEENLEWEDLQWSQTGVLVAGKTYALARVHFLAPKKK